MLPKIEQLSLELISFTDLPKKYGIAPMAAN